mmetsp:Transcript_25249/g.56649  ORF Transcript_25249/g.56649 Transcript_25249/m.56649 type:complete len:264 (-) Transcript_25249:3175-3966(-)
MDRRRGQGLPLGRDRGADRAEPDEARGDIQDAERDGLRPARHRRKQLHNRQGEVLGARPRQRGHQRHRARRRPRRRHVGRRGQQPRRLRAPPAPDLLPAVLRRHRPGKLARIRQVGLHVRLRALDQRPGRHDRPAALLLGHAGAGGDTAPDYRGDHTHALPRGPRRGGLPEGPHGQPGRGHHHADDIQELHTKVRGAVVAQSRAAQAQPPVQAGHHRGAAQVPGRHVQLHIHAARHTMRGVQGRLAGEEHGVHGRPLQQPSRA